jgi:hypothetical protein
MEVHIFKNKYPNVCADIGPSSTFPSAKEKQQEVSWIVFWKIILFLISIHGEINIHKAIISPQNMEVQNFKKTFSNVQADAGSRSAYPSATICFL